MIQLFLVISLSYTISPGIKTCLSQIDNFRNEILLTPLPSPKLLELQWKTTISYLTSWTNLLNSPLDPAFIAQLISHPTQPRLPATAKTVLTLKSALDHIRQNWDYPRPPGNEQIWEYLNTGGLHPILQAAVSHLHFAPSPLAFLIPLVYICRRGYDCHSLVCLDEFWPKNPDTYHQLLTQNSKSVSITQWLEFYCQAAVYQFGLAHRAILNLPQETHKGIWQLSDRQKAILALLETPGSSITNRKVQKLYQVSQITASRDLSRMASLGLFFSHGHGRSVYYTRI